MKNKSTMLILAVTVICCSVMALVDGVICPGYMVKSAIKIALFMIVPLVASRIDRSILYLPLLSPKKKGLLFAALLGIAVYGVIVGAYFLLSPFFDFSKIAGALTENAGVTAENFLYVSLYISFVNSFLEEFFFRGFIFQNLKNHGGRVAAYLISAISFSLYHVAMMIGWFSVAPFILVMVGLILGGIIFNFLNEKLDTIYCSWLTHMFANFAINTIGFMLLK